MQKLNDYRCIATRLIWAFIAAGGMLAVSGQAFSAELKPTLESIQENIFTPKCTMCHKGGSAPQGLSLAEGDSRDNLVGVNSNQVPNLKLVDPGNPDDSYLIHKLEGTQEEGAQMPRVGAKLTQEQIDVIRQWIADGA